LVTGDSYILLIDDGSKDNTWEQIEALSRTHPEFRGLKLSRNFGHQHAFLAGLHQANDVTITVSVDADLQDELNAIREMVMKYQQGAEIVYGVRDDRGSDSVFKRNSALLFYKMLSWMGVESVYNHADFRLMSQVTLDAFRQFGESNIYLRGMVPMLGYT